MKLSFIIDITLFLLRRNYWDNYQEDFFLFNYVESDGKLVINIEQFFNQASKKSTLHCP